MSALGPTLYELLFRLIVGLPLLVCLLLALLYLVGRDRGLR